MLQFPTAITLLSWYPLSVHHKIYGSQIGELGEESFVYSSKLLHLLPASLQAHAWKTKLYPIFILTLPNFSHENNQSISKDGLKEEALAFSTIIQGQGATIHITNLQWLIYWFWVSLKEFWEIKFGGSPATKVKTAVYRADISMALLSGADSNM